MKQNNIIIDSFGLTPICKCCLYFGTLAENCCYQCNIANDIMIMQGRYKKKEDVDLTILNTGK